MSDSRCPHCSFDPTSLNDYCDKHRPTRMSEQDARERKQLAVQIVRALFTNGEGEVAQRLVLTVDTPRPRYLGGRNERSAVHVVAKILKVSR
jgi:hypothetical protein